MKQISNQRWFIEWADEKSDLTVDYIKILYY